MSQQAQLSNEPSFATTEDYRIQLCGIEFEMYIGLSEKERTQQQRVLIDIDLKPVQGVYYVCVVEIYEMIRSNAGTRCDTQENFARKIAKGISDYTPFDELIVKTNKPDMLEYAQGAGTEWRFKA